MDFFLYKQLNHILGQGFDIAFPEGLEWAGHRAETNYFFSLNGNDEIAFTRFLHVHYNYSFRFLCGDQL